MWFINRNFDDKTETVICNLDNYGVNDDFDNYDDDFDATKYAIDNNRFGYFN